MMSTVLDIGALRYVCMYIIIYALPALYIDLTVKYLAVKMTEHRLLYFLISINIVYIMHIKQEENDCIKSTKP